MRFLNWTRAGGRPAAWRAVVDLLPFLTCAALVCAKLIYSSVLIDSEGWASNETIRQWIRPTPYFFLPILWRRPHVVLGTVAVVLVVLSPVLLLPRRGRYVVLLL